MANNYKVKMKDIQNKYKFKIFCAGYEYDDTEIRNEISQRALISEAGRYVELELNPNTYVLTAKLKDKNNNVISTSTPIDLPLESMIVDCDYDATTKSLIITLQNGNTTSIPLGDLIDGLATEEDLNEVRDNLEVVQNELNQYKTIYNVLPKVEDEGEVLTLNDTGNATLKMDLKGNTSQESTANQLYLTSVAPSGTTHNIKPPTITNGVINVQGNNSEDPQPTSYKNGYVEIFNTQVWKPNTTYYMSFKAQIVSNPKNVNQFLCYLYGSMNGFANYNSTTGRYECYISTPAEPPTADNKKYVEIRVASCELNISEVSLKLIEDYTFDGYGPSPTPEHPSPVNVVTGDNEVKIFHTLFDKSTIHSGDIKGRNSSIRLCSRQNLWLEVGTYVFRTNMVSPYKFNIGIQNVGVPPLSNYPTFSYSSDWVVPTSNDFVFTLNEAGYFSIQFSNENYGELTVDDVIDYEFILEKETTIKEQTYPINLGSMELCKTGGYQDYIAKSTGNNLFDENYYKNATYYTNVYKYTPMKIKGNRELYIKCVLKDGKTSISGLYLAISSKSNPNLAGNITYFLVTNGNINTTASKDFTGVDDLYFTYYPATITPQQIFDTYNIIVSTTSEKYEPYGKVWYKYGAIGKVVFTGANDESWYISGDATNTQRYAISVTDYGVMSASNGYCNNNRYVNSGVSRDEQLCGISSGIYYYRLNQGILSEYSATKFKEWVANNNIINYIPLATPTITPITDTTLIEQLDNLEKAYSYDTQTNISQTNQDKPFIISASALYDLNNLVTRVAILETE